MKKTLLKLAGIIMMVSAIILTQIPVLGTNASSTVYNGFMMDGKKLVKYTGTADAVSVPNGIKEIGAEAFAENTSLTSISLPGGLEKIENAAFSGCSNLKAISVPEGCKEIGNGAFADCDKLETVNLPSSLISLGTSAFAGCDILQKVNISKHNQYYVCDDGVIYNQKKTMVYQVLAGRKNEGYAMPNSVEEIKKYAFWGCDKLSSVTLSSNLKEVGDYALSNASSLDNIVLPYSVRAIRRKAFEDCNKLRDVVIPVSVSEIDPTAFDGCYNVNIKAEPGSIAENFAQEFATTKTDNVEYQDSYIDNATNKHNKENAEEKKTPYISKSYVSDVENYVDWDIDSPGVLGRSKIVSGRAVVLIDQDKVKIYDNKNNGLSDNDQSSADSEIESVVELSGDHVGYKAFYCDESLKHVQLPNSVYYIDDFAFARSGLKDIYLPAGVQKIGAAAFYHCDQLSNISIPGAVTEIGEDAFTNTAWLNNWMNGSDVDPYLIVGDGILIAYKGSGASISIPNGVKKIGPGVFMNHSEISQVYIPDSVSVVCEDAFYNCSSLMQVNGMNSVKEIRDNAFYACPISNIRISGSVEKIGLSAFGGIGGIDCVLFLGNKIPLLSFEESSTRISANRAFVFDQIHVAAVNENVDLSHLENTVLDPELPGFEGVVYQLIDNGDNKSAIPLMSTYDKENTVIIDRINIYNKSYVIKSNDKMKYAAPPVTVSQNSLQDYMVVDHSQLNKNDVTVTQSGSVMDLTGYHLYISDLVNGKDEMISKINDYYGAISEQNGFFMDISLYDSYDFVPIKSLGKSPLTITIPVPMNLIGEEICVVTLDRNNNPEVLFCSLSVKDNRQYASFEVNHFSPYILFAPQGDLKETIKEKRSNSSGEYGLDDTPDTGDFINIKLILIIGLLSLGAFLTLMGFNGLGFRKVNRQ